MTRKGHRKSRTYAERAAAGRPLVTYSLPMETKELIAKLADREGISRSELIAAATEAYAKRRRAA